MAAKSCPKTQRRWAKSHFNYHITRQRPTNGNWELENAKNRETWRMGNQRMQNGEGNACHAKWEMLRIRPEGRSACVRGSVFVVAGECVTV